MRLLFTAFCVLAFIAFSSNEVYAVQRHGTKTYSQQPIPQDSTIVTIEKPNPVDAVKTFFKNFHAQDTLALKEMILPEIMLTSMSIKGEQRRINKTKIDGFLKGIASIPDSISFEERLIEISYSSDTQVATVSTTYEFYYNNLLSHIGTNKFTLFFIDDKWIIAGIADTRIYGS